MPDPNLTGALLGSLEILSENSPLAEDSGKNAVDEFLDRINEDLVAGATEKLTDERLRHLVNLYRSQALRWEQEQQTKTTTRGRKKSHAEAIQIEL